MSESIIQLIRNWERQVKDTMSHKEKQIMSIDQKEKHILLYQI
jgi:hypothetical protein